eukprot:TRINITY_DN48503_c0_g1_i1.p1 TRINITY_DN48503_c0_g1~~TRINITY_DN48503_c0_g1_i1.p1  ORF type:complete len:160 (+),score=18.73 TRINITY_DN48503_c0_g1_i1:67-546(+)
MARRHRRGTQLVRGALMGRHMRSCLVFVFAGIGATLDCSTPMDRENMLCCEVEELQPCLIKTIQIPRDPCSIACQKRFAKLGYKCYKEFHVGFRWGLMQRNCDPQGVIKFNPPASPSPTPAPKRMVSAARRNGRSGFALIVSFVTSTCCMYIRDNLQKH